MENKLSNAVRIVSLTAIILMIAVSLYVYKAPLSVMLGFVLFILIYVQFPGMYILRILRIRPEHISTQLTIGLFTGWALEVLLYFISDPLKTNVLLYSCGPVLSVLLVYDLLKNRDQPLLVNHFDPRRLSPALCVFIALSFLFVMLKTQYVYMSPSYSEYIYMNPDKAYHMGLINSLASDYPLQSPWIQGRFIKYHIFTEILYSLPLRLYGITSDLMLATCGPLLTVYAVCLSIYSMFREFCLRRDRAGLYSLFVLLSNIYIARSATRSVALLFLYKNENAAGYGVAGSIAFLLILKYWYEAYCGTSGEDAKTGSGFRSSWQPFVLLLAFIMLATGLKGPMGAVLIASLWGSFLLGLILRSVRPAMIIPITILSAGFLLVYMTVLGMKGQGSGSGLPLFASATIANISFWKAPLIAFMKSIGLPLPVRHLVILAVFTVFLLTAFFIPFCIGYVRELFLVLTKRRSFEFTRVTIYAVIMVGLAAMMLLNYSGHSQIYFGLIAVFLSPLVAYWLIEDLEQIKPDGVMIRIIKMVFCITLIFTSVSLAYNYYDNFLEAKVHADPNHKYKKYLSITDEEYDALKWISENTPEDSLLATDRYYSVALKDYSFENRWANRFFLYAVYSDRFCYIAGSGYNLSQKDWHIREEMIELNDRLYDPSDNERGNIARELGVDYVVVSKRFTRCDDLSNSDYELCYSNSDIDIYKIKYD